MFWGLILKANRKYTQTIKQAFHLSQAALDISNSSDEPVQVVLTSDSHNYILCTLRKGKVEQVALDLSFAEGDEISFISQGNGNVHLSGYLMLEEDDLDLMGDEDSDSASEGILNHLPQKKQGKLSKEELKKAASLDDDEDDEDEDESLVNGSAEEDDDDDEEDDDDDDDDEEDDSDSADEVEEPKPKQMKLDKGKQNLGNGKAAPKEKTKKEKKKEQLKPQQQQQQNKSPKSAGEKTIQGGVKIEDIKVGAGNEAKPGKKVQVFYEGRLKSNNKVFDSSKGAGFKFNLGKGEVIKGWDVGLAGMKVGGKRRITCPPHMAYGQKGSPPVIPPNSTLVFEVELKNVF